MPDPQCVGTQRRMSTHLLTVYAMPGCPGWERAWTLLERVRAAGITGLEVRLIDLTLAASTPEWVVASPTWGLDGRRIALGNPDPDWLLARIAAVKGGD